MTRALARVCPHAGAVRPEDRAVRAGPVQAGRHVCRPGGGPLARDRGAGLGRAGTAQPPRECGGPTFASEALTRHALAAIDIDGGYGDTRDLPREGLAGYAKLLEIGAGNDQPDSAPGRRPGTPRASVPRGHPGRGSSRTLIVAEHPSRRMAVQAPAGLGNHLERPPPR